MLLKKSPHILLFALSLLAACTAKIGDKGQGQPGSGGGSGSGGSGSGGTNGPPGSPTIASFTAQPSTLTQAGQVTLSWSVTGADQISIDQGVGPVTGTSTQTTVAATTIFTLTASNAKGASTKSALVTVGASAKNPVILSFTATPASLTAAGKSTLAWNVSNADSLSIDHGVGTVTGTSVSVNVAATTIYNLTATNADGTTTATTAVVVGQNASTDGAGRFSAMVSPTNGESFIAPTTLRLVGAGRDPSIFTNTPTDGKGGNAQKLQFFVDDTVVLEVDGADAEFWIFKGFVSGVASGQHRVWARAIYPDDVLDSDPSIITVSEPPAYDMTVDLTADVNLSGSTGYELVGSADKRIRLNGNGHRITSSNGASGPLTLKFVDVFDLGDRTNTGQPSMAVTTSGQITIEDSSIDSSNTVQITQGGTKTASIQRNLFRSNMRMPIGQYPAADQMSGFSYPAVDISGTNGVFAGNNVGAGWVSVGNNWVVGGDTDADSNVLIGPRVGIYAGDSVQVRRNYSHHVYYGGWSQGSNFELGGGTGVVAENNVIYGSSWPVRGVANEFRYNLVLEAGHEWLWADHNGGNIHHNVFVGGDCDIGGIWILYNSTNVRIMNNTFDGLPDGIGTAIKIDNGMASMTSNLFTNAPNPAVDIAGGSMTTDYNLFFGAKSSYSDGRNPAHDLETDPKLSAPPKVQFDLDEVGVWKRTVTVRDVLTHYRMLYTPASGSPVIDAGDPAGGSGNDIGAVDDGDVNAGDHFGLF
jgi:hypothetical protein